MSGLRGTPGPGVIVLDNGLAGSLTGLAAAQRIKDLAPLTKIVLFTAHAELKSLADKEPAIDAFLLKTDSTQLLALAQRLTGLGALATRPVRALTDAVADAIADVVDVAIIGQGRGVIGPLRAWASAANMGLQQSPGSWRRRSGSASIHAGGHR